MSIHDDSDFLLKIVIVGDTGVGKTNLLSRFTRDAFAEDTRNTIGVDFYAKDLNLQGRSVKTQLWDTAGQEKYRAIASAYYKNAQGAVLVYDISRRETFDNVQNWLSELRAHGDDNIQLLLLGNKVDLVDKRQVMVDEGLRLAQSCGAWFAEVSGKTNAANCVNEAFLLIVDGIVKKQEMETYQRAESDLLSVRSKGIPLDQVVGKEEDKKGCC